MATMIIEGERTRAASGKTYEVRNPATGEVVDEVPAGGAADVDKAAKAAAKAFSTWSKLAPAKRAEILHKAARHMLGKVEEIAPILTKEQGKTLLESRLEAQRFGENIAWFADLADKVHGEHVSLPDTTTYGLVVRRSIGVTGAIVPWNFPLTLAANKVAPSVAAGIRNPSHERQCSDRAERADISTSMARGSVKLFDGGRASDSSSEIAVAQMSFFT